MTDDARALLADQFETHRPHLRAVAYRMLGSVDEADDALQETWLRLNRSDADAIDNLGGWLTTVIARICLDMLRSRRARHEDPMGVHVSGADHLERRDRARSGAGGAARRLGRPGPARGPRDADARRAPRLRPPRRLRPAVRRDRADRRPDADGRASAREPRPAPGPGSAGGAGRRPGRAARGRGGVHRRLADRRHRCARRGPRPGRRDPGRLRTRRSGRRPRSAAPRPSPSRRCSSAGSRTVPGRRS